jgi:hypothetical protein
LALLPPVAQSSDVPIQASGEFRHILDALHSALTSTAKYSHKACLDLLVAYNCVLRIIAGRRVSDEAHDDEKLAALNADGAALFRCVVDHKDGALVHVLLSLLLKDPGVPTPTNDNDSEYATESDSEDSDTGTHATVPSVHKYSFMRRNTKLRSSAAQVTAVAQVKTVTKTSKKEERAVLRALDRRLEWMQRVLQILGTVGNVYGAYCGSLAEGGNAIVDAIMQEITIKLEHSLGRMLAAALRSSFTGNIDDSHDVMLHEMLNAFRLADVEYCALSSSGRGKLAMAQQQLAVLVVTSITSFPYERILRRTSNSGCLLGSPGECRGVDGHVEGLVESLCCYLDSISLQVLQFVDCGDCGWPHRIACREDAMLSQVSQPRVSFADSGPAAGAPLPPGVVNNVVLFAEDEELVCCCLEALSELFIRMRARDMITVHGMKHAVPSLLAFGVFLYSLPDNLNWSVGHSAVLLSAYRETVSCLCNLLTEKNKDIGKWLAFAPLVTWLTQSDVSECADAWIHLHTDFLLTQPNASCEFESMNAFMHIVFSQF